MAPQVALSPCIGRNTAQTCEMAATMVDLLVCRHTAKIWLGPNFSFKPKLGFLSIEYTYNIRKKFNVEFTLDLLKQSTGYSCFFRGWLKGMHKMKQKSRGGKTLSLINYFSEAVLCIPFTIQNSAQLSFLQLGGRHENPREDPATILIKFLIT